MGLAFPLGRGRRTEEEGREFRGGGGVGLATISRARRPEEEKERRKPSEMAGPPALYFASVDIRHCYDTVDQVVSSERASKRARFSLPLLAPSMIYMVDGQHPCSSLFLLFRDVCTHVGVGCGVVSV